MAYHRNGARASYARAAAALLTSALIVGPAVATPGSGFTPSPQSVGVAGPIHANADRTGRWDLRLRTLADSTIGVDRLTVIPEGQSGWHTHAGITIVTVTVGEIVWYNGGHPICTPTTYRAGESFVEPANHVHLVRNTTGATAEFTAVQIRPAGAAPRIDAPKPLNCPTF